MSSGLDDVLAQLRAEFVDEAVDNLGAIEIIVEQVKSSGADAKDAIKKILRPAHSLKGTASVADFPLVATTMHRLEDYLQAITEITSEDFENLEIYIQKAYQFANINFDQKSINQADLIRQLPRAGAKKEVAVQSASDSVVKNPTIHEALVVIREKTTGLIFQRELEKFGLHVSNCRSSYDAIAMAVNTKPDIIFLSGVIDELSGADVASALLAMKPTKNLRICLITSFERNHHELDGLPHSVFLINKSKFSEGVQEALR
jgi:chemotaxis protein histidine kinase CheA